MVMKSVWILPGLFIAAAGIPAAGASTLTSTGPVTRNDGGDIKLIQKELLHDQ